MTKSNYFILLHPNIGEEEKREKKEARIRIETL